VRKGEAEKLQSAITASITEHLWKPKRKKGKPHNFWKTLFPLNALRQKMKRRRQELEIEPPLPKWTLEDEMVGKQVTAAPVDSARSR